jgi:hypothetical protein
MVKPFRSSLTPVVGHTSIEEFGANSSSIDNTLAFQKAVASGLPLSIPANKTFKINSSITVSSDTFYLQGSGYNSVLDFSGGGVAPNITGAYRATRISC